MKTCLLISSHADDIALSVASYVRTLNSPVHIAVSHSLSLEDDWKTEQTDLRKAEELAFAKKIGAILHLLDLPDSNSKGIRWDSFGRELPRSEIATLLDKLEKLVDEIAGEIWLLAPFAIGNHPDHVASYYASTLLASKHERIHKLSFYHDVPYCMHAGLMLASQKAVFESGTTEEHTFNIQEKLEDLRLYPSQLSDVYIDEIINGTKHERVTHMDLSQALKSQLCTVDSLAQHDGISLI